MALFPGIVPSSVVVYDSATGLFTVNGSALMDASVTTMTDLLALNTTTYDHQKITVTNPSGLVGNHNPADFLCIDSGFKMIGGPVLHSVGYPNLKATWPAAAWSAGALTLASAAGGAQTKLTGVAGHSLTTANQITAGDTYVYISGTTGGTVNWTVGWTKITAITDAGNDLTLLHTYAAGLGKPIITVNTAGSASEVVLQRITMPRFSTEYLGSFELECLIKNYSSASGQRPIIRYGALGIDAGGGTAIFNLNDAAASLFSLRAKVINAGSAAKNVSHAAVITYSNIYSFTAGATPLATDVDNTSNMTDVLICAQNNSGGTDLSTSLISYNTRWTY